MGLFEILMGAGQNQQEYEDFARRYEQGAPWEGYSDEEVIDRYGQVAHKLPSTDYEAAVREALSRLSPAQQAELGRYLQERSAGREVALPPPVMLPALSRGTSNVIVTDPWAFASAPLTAGTSFDALNCAVKVMGVFDGSIGLSLPHAAAIIATAAADTSFFMYPSPL